MLLRAQEDPVAVPLEEAPAAEPSPAMAQEEGPQVPEEEANLEGVEQQEPRLQRPCVDDDPW